MYTVLAVGSHLLVHEHARMTHQLQVHGWHSGTIFIEKEHKQEFIKMISCRNEKDVGAGDETTD